MRKFLSYAFGTWGSVFIAIAVTLFAFSTVLGWSYYGTKAWEHLFGTRSTVIYKVIYNKSKPKIFLSQARICHNTEISL